MSFNALHDVETNPWVALLDAIYRALEGEVFNRTASLSPLERGSLFEGFEGTASRLRVEKAARVAQAATGMGLVFDVAPDQIQRFEDVLELSDSIAPGEAENPWIVLNRDEMSSGIDTRTGIRVAEPGALSSEYYVEHAPAGLEAQEWPDFFLLARGRWAFRPHNFTGGDASIQAADFVGGHGGPDSARVALVMAGPGIAAGVSSSAPASLTDIAPTLYQLLGWPEPDNVDGRTLPAR